MKNKLLFFGVLFACLIALTPNVYAKEIEELPHFPGTGKKYHQFIAINDDLSDGTSHTQLFMFASDDDLKDLKCTLDDTGIICNNSKNFITFTYYLDNTDNQWKYYNQLNKSTFTIPFYTSTSLVYNDLYIYDKDNAIIFGKTGETMNDFVQNISTNELKSQLSNLGEPLRVVLLVGLGVMAIFICVGLIPRIIHKFM